METLTIEIMRDGKFVSLVDMETRVIELAMGIAKGNVSAAARMLGMGRSTLYRRLDKTRSQEGGENAAA
jgi:DNA-binding NtrC family response regulator